MIAYVLRPFKSDMEKKKKKPLQWEKIEEISGGATEEKSLFQNRQENQIYSIRITTL